MLNRNSQNATDSADDLVIDVTNVSVLYRIPSEPITTLKETVIRRLTGHRITYRDIWALQDINLKVRAGQAIGLIGRNGAGKSTLLRVIAHVLVPTRGRVRVVGTIAPLIELGLGMNPELTGRENIFINGAMLGYSTKEISRKYDRVVEFSELGDFIDSPLRTYSSGMMARLAFSVAVDVEPDILVVDEALSVGDEAFQRKCSDRLRQFRNQGITTIYVTHGVATLGQFCDSAVVIEAGQIVFQGEIDKAVYHYRNLIGTAQVEASSDELIGALSRPI